MRLTGAAPSRYPLLLDLSGRRVLVVGAGAVAARRLPGLIGAGADVLVVAPQLRAGFEAGLPDTVQIHERAYDSGDLAGAWLVLAATDDPAVNAAVDADAAAAGIWCIRADSTAGSARTPASAHVGDVTVAVGTDAGDPRRAAALRDAIRLLLDTGALPLRHHRGPAGGIGSVALVGGGPGDPGLLTVRGRQLLAEADAVVVDKLAPKEWLAVLDPAVEVVDAGKAPHAHNMTQDEINAELVRRARLGQRVVRLKGGDPYVFGRGGEEVLACRAAGVPVEVVPGVSSAVAVPAAAGIPVTHRGLTQDFTVVSAHLDPAADGTTVDWEALAHGQGTLVFLMGVQRLARIAEELITRGRDAGTPVAVVESGTTAAERVTIGTLADIAERAADARPPAVIVVGDVVGLRARLAPPTLLLVAHGSRDPRATASVHALAAAVAARRPSLTVGAAFLEFAEPAAAQALSALSTDRVVVAPLLLSEAFHARVDVGALVADARGRGQDVLAAAVLGQDPLLLAAAHTRLADAGIAPDAAVVLASAGTSDPEANARTRALAEELAAQRRTPVVVAHNSGPEGSVPQAVSRLQAEGRNVGVLTWLLSPGRFSDETAAAARAEGVPATTVLGTHPAVVDLVLRRYDAAVSDAAASDASSAAAKTS